MIAFLEASLRRLAACAVLLVFLAGCAWMPFIGNDDEDDEEYDNTTEHILYDSAQSSLRSGNYRAGVERLQRLEARFPFGRYAEQAQLELIYAHYMGASYDEAEAAAERFIRLHPQHKDVDYAMYLRGLVAFSEGRGLFDRFRPSDISKRDMTNIRRSFIIFTELLREHPDSDYALDARQRTVYLRNVIAEAEVNVANYYISRGAYVAAANRARTVVESYSQTPAVAEALAILVEANYRLGLDEAANDALRILAINHPRYPAFDGEGNFVLAETIRNRDRSWLNIMTLGFLDRPDVPPPIQIDHPEGFVPPEALEEDEEPSKKPWWRRIPFLG